MSGDLITHAHSIPIVIVRPSPGIRIVLAFVARPLTAERRTGRALSTLSTFCARNGRLPGGITRTAYWECRHSLCSSRHRHVGISLAEMVKLCRTQPRSFRVRVNSSMGMVKHTTCKYTSCLSLYNSDQPMGEVQLAPAMTQGQQGSADEYVLISFFMPIAVL